MPTPNREKSTIHDVAERAGVSSATVSRVINESGETAEATRERVLDAIQELQYRPNRTAKSLAQGSSQTIGVAVPTFTTPFHNELLKGVRSRLEHLDTDLLLCDLQWESPVTSLQNVLDRGAMDGLLVAGLPVEASLTEDLRPLGRSVVLLGRRSEQFDSFYWDNTSGARLATEHLLEQGHTRIGMITTHHQTPIRDARIDGYREALHEAGVEFSSDWIATGQTEKHAGFSQEAGQEAMHTLLDTAPDITAVFASSDVQAIGAWHFLRQQGLHVPDDVAIVGYDDIKVSRFIGLTSVAQNMHDIGEEATDLLIRRMHRNGPTDLHSRLVQSELVVRSTTGAAARSA